MDIDMNNIKVKYNGSEISIANHLMDGVTSAREVAVILPIKIVGNFDSSVESLEAAIEAAKKIIDEVNELTYLVNEAGFTDGFEKLANVVSEIGGKP